MCTCCPWEIEALLILNPWCSLCILSRWSNSEICLRQFEFPTITIPSCPPCVLDLIKACSTFLTSWCSCNAIQDLIDNQHLKRLSHLWAVGVMENLKTHSENTAAQQRQNDNYWYMSVPWALVHRSYLLLLPESIILCVVPHLQGKDGGQAADSHDRWQSLCVHECVFVFYFFILQSLCQTKSVQCHCLPPHLMAPTALMCDVFEYVWGS